MSTKSDKTISANDENQDRGNWDHKADYLLSCIGYAVGLGNVWRFPYLAFENGGGAFLIPYLIMLVFAGMPVFFLESALGQFSSLGPISAFKFSPILKGIGVCMVILNILVSIYYNVIIAYTVFYFFASLTADLPWESCGNWWNNDTTCSTTFSNYCDVINLTTIRNDPIVTNWATNNQLSLGQTYIFNSVPLSAADDLASKLSLNLSEIGCTKFTSARGTSASEEFWEYCYVIQGIVTSGSVVFIFSYYALQRSPSIDETGSVVTHLTLSLLLSWIVVYFSMIRGIKSSGKVVYFTALFPYVVLLILLVRGATLEGAYDGVQYYIGSQSDLSKLQDANVWKAAATQIFYSLSAAWGGLIALSSYNKFNNNCYYDTIIVCTVNSATSFFAGFAIFTVVGHMAHILGKKVDEVVKSGFSLAFIAYPEAIAQLPVSPFWALLFFLMLFTLGLDSQFTGVEAILTAFTDLFPRQLRSKRAILTLATIIVLFLLGIPCVCESGIYWLNLIDWYSAGWGLIIIAVLELMGVMWVYGGNRFIEDIEMMIGKKDWLFWLYWRACWFFISPLLLLAVLIWSLVTDTAPDYAGVVYPDWAIAIGWLTVIAGLVFIPIMAIIAVIEKKGNVFEASEPSSDWGPYLKKFRGFRYANMDEPVESLNKSNDMDEPVESLNKPNDMDEPVESLNIPNDMDEPVESLNKPNDMDEPVESLNKPNDMDEPVESLNKPNDEAVEMKGESNEGFKEDEL